MLLYVCVCIYTGHLLGSGLGVVIDAHDQVLRFNEAPTATFEPDVGTMEHL
jgi:hypothetical protein